MALQLFYTDGTREQSDSAINQEIQWAQPKRKYNNKNNNQY